MALNRKTLYDSNSALNVLGCLMRNPLLCQDAAYPLQPNDFANNIHKLIFSSIFNLAANGYATISPSDIDMDLSQYDAQYESYKRNHGFELLQQCEKLFDENVKDVTPQFKLYYARVKKFSVIRDLEIAGIDTSIVYDPEKDILNHDVEDEKLNKYTIQQIIDTFRDRMAIIEDRHVSKVSSSCQYAYEGIEELIQQFEEKPEIGLSLDGDIVNYALSGARLGKMYLYSAPSGQGKTRHMVGDACALSLPYLDQHGNVVWRGNPDGSMYQKVLFVATEQKADEIQTLILAYMSGVNERKITHNECSTEEKERLKKAVQLLKRFKENFMIECIPDPSIETVKAKITKYIVQGGFRYIFYDYIFTSPSLVTEFAGAHIREDVALMMLSNTLKEIAMNYDVFIESGTQLNESWSKTIVGLRDQNCIRGSKAICDKADIGMIGIRLQDEERERIDVIWNELKKTFPDKYGAVEPNMVVDIYKNRRGEMVGVKIFRYFDYATCHCTDLFVTDSSYKAVAEVRTENKNVEIYDFLTLKTIGALKEIN